ncbi:MAG TPA: TetR/AcrR family transcriptional regulator [Candidatus Eisenbacteria bacterium]|nr:TetR/AcrR family transcriptional regulator [Candidatus Eisenbacteria bacterium]
MAPERARSRDDQRARIVDAARRLFASRGFDEVTMADVAADAGVARATVFNHFGSKHALVEAITEDVIAYYDGMLRNALADTSTPTPTLVRALFDEMGAGIEEDRRFYRGVFREIAKVRLGLDEGGVGQRAGEAALELLVQLLARGQERGELSRTFRAQDLASAFDSLVNGTITHWLYGDAAEPLRERMGRAAAVFLGEVATGTPAKRRPPPTLAPRRMRHRR